MRKKISRNKKLNSPIIILLIFIIIIIVTVADFKTNKKITEKKEDKKYKTIDIYKYSYVNMDGDDYYGDDSDENNNEDVTREKVGSITCKTDDCYVEDAYKEYALVKENDSYSLINYLNDKIIVEGFAKNKEQNDVVALLTDLDNNVHGITHQTANNATIYSLKSDKTIIVEGEVLSSQDLNSKYLYYKDLYATVKNSEGKVKVIIYDINSGNKIIEHDSYPKEIIGNSDEIIIEFYDDTTDKTLTYNSSGKLVLNNINFIDSIYMNDGDLIIISNNKYSAYDIKSLEKKYESKKFSDIFYVGDNYMLVVNDNNLNVVDLNGNLLTTFIENYDSDNNKIRSMYVDNNTINVMIESDNVSIYEVLNEHSDITEEDLNAYYLGFRYYYNINTKEVGRQATYM